MKVVPLSKGKSAIVDDDDFEWISEFRWHVNDWGYAVRNKRVTKGKFTTVGMAREIMEPPAGMEVDHIDRNKLNNSKSNLRIVDKQKNVWNRGANGNNLTGIKGVGWHKGHKKFHARIRTSERLIHLGYFTDILEAQRVYHDKAIELRGEFVPL